MKHVHVGLYLGLYTRVRDCAELLDDVIIRLKSGTSSSADERRQRLAKILIGAEQGKAADLTSQLLTILVREVAGDIPKQWPEVGKALLSPEVAPSIIDQLEVLARGIEQERAGMLLVMLGRGR